MKLAKPGSREQLLVDSGFRCHLTDFNRTTAAAPSAFVSRLRKYLKSRRVTSVKQIGTDRVIEIEFSDGQYRLFLEFFAAGNIILTDKDFTVLALLRVVSEGHEDVDVKLGGTYSIKGKQNVDGIPQLTDERLKDALSKHIAKSTLSTEAMGKKLKKKGGDELRRAINAGFPEYPPHLLDHAFHVMSFDAKVKPEQVMGDERLLSELMTVVKTADGIFQKLTAVEQSKGYIIAKSKDKEPGEASSDDKNQTSLLYDDYHPFKPSQVQSKPELSILEFDSFNKTVDEFYSSIESQKLESRLTEREITAKRKLEFARREHEKRVGALREAQELHIRKAEAIEVNSHRVEEAIAAVNGLIGQGMDWQDIGKLIENEQKRENPVAQMVKLPLKLYENTVTLLLHEPFFDDDDDDDGELVDNDTDEEPESDSEKSSDAEEPDRQKKEHTLAIDVDLALSPWANARQYYEQKKTAQAKEEKTIQSSTKALKSAEHKINDDLKKGLKQEKPTLRPARRQSWFEKFFYFISSDGYLVVGGKDAQQNETLYRRYLKKGDIYVHADLQGAASVIVKNMINNPDALVPPSTLSQAGSLSVCSSAAWDSKAVMGAWWVNADQVSKTAPTGEYLKTGGFTIKGKKNFLPPAQLILGFSVMFQISEESKANHSKHRYQDPTERIAAITEEQVERDLEYMDINEDGRVGEDDLSASDHKHETDMESEDGSFIAEEKPRSNPLQHDNETEKHQRGETVDNEKTPTAAQNGIDKSPPPQEDPIDSNDIDKTEVKADISVTAHDTETAGKFGKRHLSARERRLLRQGKPLDQFGAETTDAFLKPSEIGGDAGESESPSRGTDEKPSVVTTGTSTPAPAPRGKRAKNKKAARKYADQDDEDRELAMKLLGSAAGQQKKQAAAVDKAARDAKLAADKERRRKQHERAAEAEKTRQERLAAGDAEGAEEEVDEEVLEQERREIANLDSLVGTPAVGDEILAAIPICAPWNALARHKYKVKIQPGNLKKGKAVREIVNRWLEAGKSDSKRKIVDETATDRERIWPREIEVIKGWRVEEIIGIVPVSKLRVMQAGGTGGGSGSGGSKSKGTPSSRGGRGSKKK